MLNVSQKVADLVMKEDVWNLRYLKAIVQHNKMVCEALKQNGILLQYVRIFITQEMVDIAIDNNIHAFPYVPARFQTEEMLRRYNDVNH